MFTEKELTEIQEAHKAVYKAIRKNFGADRSDRFADMRACEETAGRIVAAKIIADATEGLKYRSRVGGPG